MNYCVILSPDAEENIRAVIRWYLDIQLELSFRFRRETQAVLRRVGQNPFQFPLTNKLTRKALLRRFPYTIYFTFDGEEVLVLAILHQRRFTPWNEP
jgi:plasmid stabilization system protein ParE